jgi:hypothetical protein
MRSLIAVVVLLGCVPLAHARKKWNPPPDQQSLTGAYWRAQNRLERWRLPFYQSSANYGTWGRINSADENVQRGQGPSYPPPWIDRLDGPFSF